jgi:Transglycosylase SLT domain
MASPRRARVSSHRTPIRRGTRSLLRRCWKCVRWVGRKLAAAPLAIRIAPIVATVLVVFFSANFLYHVVRKPTEMFFPVSGALNKTPLETWRQYAPLFREYSTAAITPELLAALAQVESAGNPLASTYWRWRLTWDPFAIYQPASTAVGMYQMTDPTFAETRRYCIRDHIIVDDGCSWNWLDIRVAPSRAVELASVYLDRNITQIVAHRRPAATPQQTQELAAIIHLCGAGSARAFARRGFSPTAGERCGDHDVAGYLAQINMMKREFQRFAADERKGIQ